MELLVVLLVIGILLAIAIPTYLHVTGSAADRVAQVNITNALTVENEYYTSNQQYTSNLSTLASLEPAISWAGSPPQASIALQVGQVGIQAVSSNSSVNDAVVIMALSSTGTCFFLGEEALPGSYAQGSWYTESTGNASGACTYPTQIQTRPLSSNPPTGPGSASRWGSSW